MQQLAVLAEKLGYPEQWFLESSAKIAFFRDTGETYDKESEKELAWLEGFSARLKVLRDYTVKLPLPRPKTIVGIKAPQSIEDCIIAAGLVRKELGLGSAPAPDMFTLVESAGCLCVVRPMQADLDAVYVPSPTGLTLLNGSRPGIRQRFTLAHELAHHLFHSTSVVVDLDLFSRDRRELLANAFAAHFLMPADGLRMELRQHFGIERPATAEHAFWLAYYFGVSMDALCFQLGNTGLATSQATTAWRSVKRKALLAVLGLDEQASSEAVQNRWPPEFIQRLQFGLSQGMLGHQEVERHLGGDRAATKLVELAAVS